MMKNDDLNLDYLEQGNLAYSIIETTSPDTNLDELISDIAYVAAELEQFEGQGLKAGDLYSSSADEFKSKRHYSMPRFEIDTLDYFNDTDRKVADVMRDLTILRDRLSKIDSQIPAEYAFILLKDLD